MNATQDLGKLQFQVDREHSGLRLGMVAIFLIILVVVFSIANSLIPSDGFNILAGIIAFAAAAIVMRLADPVMKRMWPSKRSLQLDADGARLLMNDTVQSEIRSDATANVHYWSFKIPRRGRMPKGWYVVACALQQDDTYLAVYTFASPDQTDEINKLKSFTELQSDKKMSAAKAESLRLAGEQRRLRLAEEHRWHDGGELTPADFETFIKQLNELYVRWNT